jgi:hypothetical protein
MHESDTYQAILEEGMAKGGRRIILLIGEDRCGPPEEGVKAALNTITDVERLMRMVRCAAKAANWQEILDTP